MNRFIGSRRPLITMLCSSAILGTTAVALAGPVTAAPGNTIPGTGTYEVEKDFAAGVYRSTGNTSCYWSRAKDASGSFESIIANDFGGGQRLVYVRGTDKVFKTSDCGDWALIPSSTLTSKSTATTISGTGWYLVGADFLPGTYRSTGNTESCYWARTRSADGEFGSIIANDMSTGQLVVTIDATDVVFQTSGCAAWTRSD
jgi:hypothetical protein